MEKPLESRIRSSKSTTPPKPPHGHTPSPEPNARLEGRHNVHPKLSSRRTTSGVGSGGHGSAGHTPIAMSKSVSPPKATPSSRYLSSTTHSDAQTTSVSNSSSLPPVPPCPAPRPQLTVSGGHGQYQHIGHAQQPRVPPVISSQPPTIPMALSSTEKSKLLPDLKDLGHPHHQTGPNLSDKDCSYVKFPRRMDPSHEYSYPKLIDAYSKPDANQVSSAITAASTTATPSKSKAATPPLPPGGPGLQSKIVVGVATSSSNSSGSSKKSRRSLPSLVLSCGGRGNQNDSGGTAGGNTVASDTSGTFVTHSTGHAHGYDSSLSPERDSSDTSGGPVSHLCIHCRKSYNPGSNTKGSCRYAPNDWVRSTVETVTCLSCARCLLYHCIRYHSYIT